VRLIDKIVLRPTPDKDPLTVDLMGDLAGILSVATQKEKLLIESGLSLFNPAYEKQQALVAGLTTT
jgi:site-specific DNA recombinase